MQIQKIQPQLYHHKIRIPLIVQTFLFTLFGLLISQSLRNPSALYASEPSNKIVINEIHYNPHIKTELAEYIEIYNNSDLPIQLTGWQLSGAVEFTFPYTIIAPQQYLVVAQHPETMRRLWNVSAVGAYTGRLSTQGETITLRNLTADIVDEVSFQLGFPWPTVGDWPGNSIGLIHPDMDNDFGGSWRGNAPSPAARNIQFSTNAPPTIEQVQHSPQQPTSNSYVSISARVNDPDGIQSVELSYQIIEPGQYFSIANAEYYTGWTTVSMQATGDNNSRGMLYSVNLSPDVQKHRRLIRYRIRVSDSVGNTVLTPYADDPQPNFAYFVYDAIPPWRGAVRPGFDTPIVYEFAAMNPLPVYHLIAAYDDVRDALFESQYTESQFPWTGTLVYNGVVYDHIGFRARGGGWRYALGKNMVKFDFNRGHYFQGYDDRGNPYEHKWDKLNFSAIIQHPNRNHRGEHGLFEAVGYKLFNLAGVAAPKTNYVHFRIIDEQDEVTGDQYEGDFMGLYLVVEQMDGIFLKSHDLPDGNLYKMEKPAGYLNNQGANAATDGSDLYAFMAGYQRRRPHPTEEWWRANVELEEYYSFRAIVEAIHHYDINNGKNYFYYLNPETGRWQVHPWDIDQTWMEKTTGNGVEPFYDANIFELNSIGIEYRNRLREIRDLLFNREQILAMINEYADIIDMPTTIPSMVDADRALWDYHPIMKSSFVSFQKTELGAYYKLSPTGDFRGMISVMDNYVQKRAKWIDKTLLDDPKVPDRPIISYAGPANYPADKLQFASSSFNDPTPNYQFSAMEWRIAELNYPGIPTYTPNEPRQYEIEATWESGELQVFNSTVTLPHGACRVERTCRARVRMKNDRGRWGHWSDPLEFIAGQPVEAIEGILKPTEIMYQPTSLGVAPSDELEFLELKNVGNEQLDLTNMYFSSAIEYKFPIGATIDAGDMIILASNAARFQERYGLQPFGEYKGQLKDGGELIVLRDASDRTAFSVEYDNKSPWPLLSDEGGHSIVLNVFADLSTNLSDTDKWRKSTLSIGSPGADDPAEVVINEVLANPGIGQVQAIELWNSTRRDIKLDHWYLSNDPNEPRKYRFPAGTTVPAGGFRFLRVSEFAASGNGPGFTLNPLGGVVYLYSAAKTGRLTGYQQRFSYGSSETGYSFGRHVTSIGEVRYPLLYPETMGEPNVEPVNGPVVVTRLRYHGAIEDEFIELTNVTSAAVNLYDTGNLQDRWQLKGIFFNFPVGLTLEAGESIYLVPTAPSSFCQSDIIQTHLRAAQQAGSRNRPRVTGPYAMSLAETSGEFALLRPGTKPLSGPRPYFPVDTVRYKKGAPWPNVAGDPTAILERVAPSAYGDDPLSWIKSRAANAATAHPTEMNSATAPENSLGPTASICSFNVAIKQNLPNGVREAGKSKTVIEWTMYSEENVSGYNLWGNNTDSRASATRLNEEVIPLQQFATVGTNVNESAPLASYSYDYIATTGESDQSDDGLFGYNYYWLEAVDDNEIATTVAFTSKQQPPRILYLPISGR